MPGLWLEAGAVNYFNDRISSVYSSKPILPIESSKGRTVIFNISLLIVLRIWGLSHLEIPNFSERVLAAKQVTSHNVHKVLDIVGRN